jgi:L-lactate utilization protein LutB
MNLSTGLNLGFHYPELNCYIFTQLLYIMFLKAFAEYPGVSKLCGSCQTPIPASSPVARTLSKVR